MHFLIFVSLNSTGHSTTVLLQYCTAVVSAEILRHSGGTKLSWSPPWWEHKPLRTEPQPVIVMVIIYLNYLESRMCMNTSNLFMQKSKSGHMSMRCALSDCKILFEMLLYFSTSDLRYFLESNLYFIQIWIFWFVANRFKIWSFGACMTSLPKF